MTRTQKPRALMIHGAATAQETSDSIIKCRCPRCGHTCYFPERFLRVLATFSEITGRPLDTYPLHASCQTELDVIGVKVPGFGWVYDDDIDDALAMWEESLMRHD